MEPQYFFWMRDAKQALLCVKDLEEHSISPAVSAGVVAVMDDNAKTDWYVFADIENPSQDRGRLARMTQ
jgi:hypothetical protein